MDFKYFELAMVIVSVTPLLVLLVTYFGLGFQMSYKSDKPQQEAQSQPPQLPRP